MNLTSWLGFRKQVNNTRKTKIIIQTFHENYVPTLLTDSSFNEYVIRNDVMLATCSLVVLNLYLSHQ